MQPLIILKNQFGEQSSNYVVGGQLSCNFVVDSANGNGLGIRNLKGFGVASVFMHTSSTPATGNPNPVVGGILIKLSQSYAGYDRGIAGFVSPSTGSPTASPSNHAMVYIAVLGSSTLAQWQASGLPVGAVPAVGASFISNGVAIAGGGTVIGPGASGIMSVEVVGDPNTTVSAIGGGYLLVQCLNTSGAPAAPADNSVVSLFFSMTNPALES